MYHLVTQTPKQKQVAGEEIILGYLQTLHPYPATVLCQLQPCENGSRIISYHHKDSWNTRWPVSTEFSDVLKSMLYLEKEEVKYDIIT